MGLMKNFMLICLLFSFMMSLFVAADDNYLLDFGSSINTTVDGRVFAGDQYLPGAITAPDRVVATANMTSLRSARDGALYQSAWIFTASSSFRFPIQQQGRHWIRLYFLPFVYQSYDLTAAEFSVSADGLALLTDFQVRNGTVFKEFLVNITSDGLELSFTPSTGSFAFINAMEVVSVYNGLISDTALSVNPTRDYTCLLSFAFETTFRVNMGGPLVTPFNDTHSRTWLPDQSFLLVSDLAMAAPPFVGNLNFIDGGSTRDIAPDAVYRTATEMNSVNVSNPNFNVTWAFDIDPAFLYLVRMHFCDIVSTSPGQLYFNVYINSWSAIQAFDISTATISTLAAPLYRDFVVRIPDGSRRLLVSIGPVVGNNINPNAILNGLEILKMMDSSSFIGAASSRNNGTIIGVIVGSVVAVIFIVAVYFICRRRKVEKLPSKTWVPFSFTIGSKFSNATVSAVSGLNLGGGLNFSLATLQEATNNFDETWVIGVGGFGKVYKGTLKDGTKVAAKRGNPSSQQGLREFRTEIEMLSNFRHRHLVNLIGYCDERNEMILVYEYMENGPLKSHLYGFDLPSLSWKQRLEICIGSARGLHYLHTGSTKAIIHRDVKSANILLDESFMAKVADFGLSKAGPELDQTHVSTAVKGSFGYLDPEYFRRQQLTEKSDVYSFGVVMLEVLCARPVIDPSQPREKVSLAEWGMQWQKKGELEKIVDPRLAGQIKPESLRKFGDTIEKCLAEFGVDRPSMGDVLWNLEYVLQLQEALSERELTENSLNSSVPQVSPQIETLIHIGEERSAERDGPVEPVEDLSDVSMSKVFSQLVKSEGR